MALTDMVIMPGADYRDACDAVREKTGGTADIKSGELGPQIRAIETGGNTDIEDALVTRTITEYSNDRVTSIGSYAFSYCNQLTTVDIPAATSIGSYAFYSCSRLTTVDFPVATSIGNYAFSYCNQLTTADIPAATSIGSQAFSYCNRLTTADFPAATSIGSYAFYSCSTLTTADIPAATSIGSYAFYSCSRLTTVDFPVATSIGPYAFYSCSALTTVILRNTGKVCTLAGTTAFGSTPIASGTGYIYVPAALVDSYKAATNWSTYADQIRAIEDYPDITGG